MEIIFWISIINRQKRFRERIDWTIKVIKDTQYIPEKYFKHIVGTDLYEIRVSSGNNIFRIFCFFDIDQLVVVIIGFQKKTQKTPLNQIAKAIRLKKQYYEDKEK